MIVLSHQMPMQSIARTDGQDGHGDEGPGKKHRFDFERFSSLPREVFAFFSRSSD